MSNLNNMISRYSLLLEDINSSNILELNDDGNVIVTLKNNGVNTTIKIDVKDSKLTIYERDFSDIILSKLIIDFDSYKDGGLVLFQSSSFGDKFLDSNICAGLKDNIISFLNIFPDLYKDKISYKLKEKSIEFYTNRNTGEVQYTGTFINTRGILINLSDDKIPVVFLPKSITKKPDKNKNEIIEHYSINQILSIKNSVDNFKNNLKKSIFNSDIDSKKYFKNKNE